MQDSEKAFDLIRNILLDMNYTLMKTQHSMNKNNGLQWQHGTVLQFSNYEMSKQNSIFGQVIIFFVYIFKKGRLLRVES